MLQYPFQTHNKRTEIEEREYITKYKENALFWEMSHNNLSKKSNLNIASLYSFEPSEQGLFKYAIENDLL